MKKRNLQLLFTSASFLIFAAANVGMAFAQLSNAHRYQVSSTAKTNSDATVETSSDSKITSVAVKRKNQATNYYTSYSEVLVSTMRTGKKDVFTVYGKEQQVKAGVFNNKLSEVSGIARGKRAEIAPIREKLEEDMEILRAIRAFDKDADVILAELSYAIVTYNGSILDKTDSEILNKYVVTEITHNKFISKAKAENNRIFKKTSLVTSTPCDHAQCIQGAYDRYNECKGDVAISDKSICYNNRSNEVQSCNANCNDAPVDPPQSFIPRRKENQDKIARTNK